jgi:hypothetical protein
MFNFLRRRGSDERDFDLPQEIEKLNAIGPPSALVVLLPAAGGGQNEDLGRAYFLRRDGRLYTEAGHIYITTPDNLKITGEQLLNARLVSLQFFERRVPYRIRCRIVGRFRLLPEVVESLDFIARSAVKLQLVGPIRKEDKRQFYRYNTKNYGDGRVPLTTHVTFDAYIQATTQEFPEHGAAPTLLTDLQLRPYNPSVPPEPFSPRQAIAAFREVMLQRPPHERSVTVTKIRREDTPGMARRRNEQTILGEIHVLGLEMESLRDVVYLKKSAKAAGRKTRETAHNLHQGETILINYVHERKHFQIACAVMETRTQNDVVRPLHHPVEEPGLRVELVNYSVGGALVESSPQLLQFLLGDTCPPKADREVDYSGVVWQRAFTRLRRPMLHLTLYPCRHFPEALKRFEPELPAKIQLICQVVRSVSRTIGERRVLQHGLQFAYEPQGVAVREGDIVDWRWTQHIRDNEHLIRIHSCLNQLYGFLETQSLAAGASRRPKRGAAAATD